MSEPISWRDTLGLAQQVSGPNSADIAAIRRHCTRYVRLANYKDKLLRDGFIHAFWIGALAQAQISNLQVPSEVYGLLVAGDYDKLVDNLQEGA